MLIIHPQFITDDKGKKTAVILPLEEFDSIMEKLEELEDIKRYDQAKKKKPAYVDAEDAFLKIEKNKKNLA